MTQPDFEPEPQGTSPERHENGCILMQTFRPDGTLYLTKDSENEVIREALWIIHCFHNDFIFYYVKGLNALISLINLQTLPKNMLLP